MNVDGSGFFRLVAAGGVSFLLITGAALAQDSTTTPEVNPSSDGEVEESGARIEFEETTFDFGNVTDRAPMTHDFKFKNVGTDVLRITKVNWGCSCTSGRARKTELAPGEEGIIEVTFDPRKRSGHYKKNANVWTNDPTNSRVSLWFDAEIDPIALTWPSLLRVPNVAFRHDGTAEFFVTSDRPEFEIIQIESNSPLLSAKVVRTEIVEKQPQWKAHKDERPIHQVFIELTVGKEAAIGSVRGILSLTARVVNEAGETFNHRMTVEVQATVLGPIAVNPGRVNLGNRRAGQKIQRTVRIQSRTELDDFKIVSVEHETKDGATPDVEWAEISLGGVNRAYDLRISMTAPEKPRLYRGILIVNTDNPFEPFVKIPWSIFVKP